ncbi:MAG: hypothetical protein EBR54_04745 [Flavobacteriia bacterium]|nr:hypothetical protein [Flavobacteriia bacterium]
MNFSAGNLDKLVDYVVNENSKRLKVELQKNTVSNKIAGSLTDTTINDADFVKIIDTLETEKQLKLKQSENERYANYFKSEIPKIDISAFPVVTSSQLDKEIKDLNKKINDKISVDSKASLESAKMLAQMKNESYYYSYEQIKVFELKMSRTNMLNKSELKSMKDELSFRKSCGLKYGLTLFFFLIGKALIFGLLLTLIINLFGFSVKPIYDMHTSNYLADEVKSTQEKNRLQPWIGILLLGLIIGLFLGNGFGKISGYFVPGKETNKSTQEMNVKSPNSEQESPNQSYDTDVSGPIQDDEMNQVDTPDGEYYAEDFNCFDGSIIPMEYVNNGTCDCGGCEDEGGE